MENGFYHPERGYWQTTGTPPQNILDAYPDGTVKVPLKPDANAVWDGLAWKNGPAPAPTIEDYRAAVQAHVDAVAVSRLYTDGNSLATYATSTVPQWAAEAQAFVSWRDAVWAQVYTLCADPPDPAPTIEALIAGLPQIEW